MGLVGGMKSISYIVLLLSLIFYLFAISGMMIFKKNDPFHWHSLPIAMMTLFRISTLEDWTDIMYMSIFGCDEYNSGGGLTYCNPATEDCSMLTDWQIDDDGNKVSHNMCEQRERRCEGRPRTRSSRARSATQAAQNHLPRTTGEQTIGSNMRRGRARARENALFASERL